MIAMVGVFRAKAGEEQQFEAGFSELMAAVRANEPNTLVYQVCRSRTEQGVYKILELFASQDDLDAHMRTDWLKSIGPKIWPHMDGAPILEQLDPLD